MTEENKKDQKTFDFIERHRNLNPNEALEKYNEQYLLHKQNWFFVKDNIMLPEFQRTRRAGLLLFVFPPLTNIFFIFNQDLVFKKYVKLAVPVIFFWNFLSELNKDLAHIAVDNEGPLGKKLREISKNRSWFDPHVMNFSKKIREDFEKNEKIEKKEDPKPKK